MSIIIAADTVPTSENVDLFSSGNMAELFGEDIINIFSSADKRIINLEVPLVDCDSPIKKNGPSLRAPRDTIAGYKKLGVDIASIANNHIMDHGDLGLNSTIDVLNSNDISYLGAGKNIYDAEKPYIFVFNGQKIGLFSCAEHEFSIATPSSSGANPFDDLETPDKIKELKDKCDFVIVLYHGGRELYRYPTPDLRKRCRKMVEKGADLVICQHSHCVGCEEKYNGSTIVYGQGNFIFDLMENDEWKTGMLISLNDDFSVSYIPTIKKNCVVRKANEIESKEILDGFYSRSEEIKAHGFVEQKFSDLAASVSDRYMFMLYGKRSFVFKAIDKISGHRFSKWHLERKYSSSQLRMIRNIVECEAHRELFLEFLKNK